MKSHPPFYLIYDSHCPLCTKELQWLKRRDKHNHLRLIDLHSPHFSKHFPTLKQQQVMERLHGFYLRPSNPDGGWYYGLDATYHAWSAVGLGWAIKPLRWPIVRTVSDLAYSGFAKHRHQLAKVLTGQSQCESCNGISQPSRSRSE